MQGFARGQREYPVYDSNANDMVAFPVSSQIDGSGHALFRGLHPMTGRIEVVRNPGGDFQSVNSDALTASLIDHMPARVLAGIRKLLIDTGASDVRMDSSLDTIKTLMKNHDSRINFETVFFKWGVCLNDAYAIKNISVGDTQVIIDSSSVSARYAGTPMIVDLGIGFSGKQERDNGNGHGGNGGNSKTGLGGGQGGQGGNGGNQNGGGQGGR